MIPRSSFNSVVSNIPEGIIPWVFGSGGTINSDSFRVVPSAIRWTEKTLVLQYPSYSYENSAGCVISSPSITAFLRGFCCQGIARLTVHCFKGNKQEFVEYTMQPGGFNFNASPSLIENCGRSYSQPFVNASFNSNHFARWLSVVLQSRAAIGTSNEWFTKMLNNIGKPTPVQYCDDCQAIHQAVLVQTDLGWLTIQDQYSDLETETSPYQYTTASELVKIAESDYFITVVDKQNRAAKNFFRQEVYCDGDFPYLTETNGFIKEECFEQPDEEDDEPDEDDDWDDKCDLQDTCIRDLRVYAYNSTSEFQFVMNPGRYPNAGAITSSLQRISWSRVVEGLQDGSKVYEVISQYMIVEIQRLGIAKYLPDGSCYSTASAIVTIVDRFYRVVKYVGDYGLAEFKAAQYSAGIPNYGADMVAATNAAQSVCGAPTGYNPPPDRPYNKERQKKGPCEDNCYVKGNFSIDLSFGLKPFLKGFGKTPLDPLSPAGSYKPELNPRIGGASGIDLRKQDIDLAKPPLQQNDTVTIDFFNINVPFQICLEDGQQTIGDFTVAMNGSVLEISYKGETFSVDLNDIFGVYNQLSFLVDVVNPAPFGINDVEIICPDGDLA